jgi:hypothetical protein
MSVNLYLFNEAEHLRAEHGGTWGEHPDFPASDWMYEVSNGDTRLGYWEWCAASMPAEEADQ